MENYPGKFFLTEEAKEAGFKFPDEQLWLLVIGEGELEVIKAKQLELPFTKSEDEEC